MSSGSCGAWVHFSQGSTIKQNKQNKSRTFVSTSKVSKGTVGKITNCQMYDPNKACSRANWERKAFRDKSRYRTHWIIASLYRGTQAGERKLKLFSNRPGGGKQRRNDRHLILSTGQGGPGRLDSTNDPGEKLQECAKCLSNVDTSISIWREGTEGIFSECPRNFPSLVLLWLFTSHSRVEWTNCMRKRYSLDLEALIMTGITFGVAVSANQRGGFEIGRLESFQEYWKKELCGSE